MKNVDDEAQPSTNVYYDSVIVSSEAMQDFIDHYKDDYLEVIRFYQYVLRRASGFSTMHKIKSEEATPYEAALSELKKTEAVQKFISHEITQEDVDKFEIQKREEIKEILTNLAKRKGKRVPKNVVKDEDYSMDEFFKELVQGNNVTWYINKYSDIEIIQFYQYVLEKASALNVDLNKLQNSIALCWLASTELEETEAVKKYHNMEITQDEIDAYNKQIEDEIEESSRICSKKQNDKKSLVKQFVRMFKK